MPRKTLKTQAQQLVLNLCEYFEMEKVNRGPLLPVSSVQERVANALKISRKTVYSIKKREETQPFLSSPGKSRSRPKPKTTDLPEVTKMAVRNTLYDMYKERKYVTLKSLKPELRNKQIVSLGKTSLNILLKELGFKYKKDDNRRALIEKPVPFEALTNLPGPSNIYRKIFNDDSDSTLDRTPPKGLATSKEELTTSSETSDKESDLGDMTITNVDVVADT